MLKTSCWRDADMEAGTGDREKSCRLFIQSQAELSPAVTYNTPSSLVFPLQPIIHFISLKHGYPEPPVSHVLLEKSKRLSSGKHTSVTKEKSVSSF